MEASTAIAVAKPRGYRLHLPPSITVCLPPHQRRTPEFIHSTAHRHSLLQIHTRSLSIDLYARSNSSYRIPLLNFLVPWKPSNTDQSQNLNPYPNNRKMKITVVSLALALSAAASANPAAQAAPGLLVRDTPTGTIDCNYCTGILDFCFQVGRYILNIHQVWGVDADAERSHPRSRRLQADLPRARVSPHTRGEFEHVGSMAHTEHL